MPASTRSTRSGTARSTRSKQSATSPKKTTKAATSKKTTKAATSKKATKATKSTKSTGRAKAAKSTAVANPYAKKAVSTKPKTSRRVNAPKKADIDALLAPFSGPPMAASDVSEDDIAASLAIVNDVNKTDPKEIAYASATNHSSAHTVKCIKMIENLNAVVVSRSTKFGPGMTALVSTAMGPFAKIIVALGGKKTPDKIKLASAVLWAFVEQQRNTRSGGGNRCPFLQPNSQSVYLRTLVGALATHFNWEYSLSEDFNFPGGLLPRINKLYAERAAQYPEVYGTGSNKQEIKEIDASHQLDLGKFDETVPLDLIMKCLVIIGSFFGARGNKEHANMGVCNIERGIISETGHEYYGCEYIALTNLQDKTHKISFYNPIARQSNHMRLPVVGDKSPAAFIIRYLGHLSPGQTRLYCKPATAKQIAHFATLGWPNAKFSPDQPLGHNTISNLMKKASERLGFDVTGHAFRRLFITTLVNDGRVSVEESLAAARHSSVAAQRTYMARNGTSEANRFKALGQLPPPKTD